MFINKIDNEKSRYKDKKFVKLHNIFENIDGLDGEFKDEAMSVKEALMELIAETYDEILDKYFSGEELNAQEIQKRFTIGIQRGYIIPIICGSTLNNIGTTEILDIVSKYLEPKYLDKDSTFKGFVFKTVVDPFIGKISY